MSHYKDLSEAQVYDKDGIPVYGLDQELHKKQAEKHDPQKEKEVKSWIQEVTGKSLPSDDFQESLKDGVLLCELINKIKPGSIKKVNKSKLPFMQMENIGSFLTVAQDLGLPKHDTFMTVDLYEGKNIPQVVQSLYILGSVVQKLPGYNLPRIGVKLADKKTFNWTEEQLRQSSNTVGLQYEGSVKHKTDPSISRNVVKTTEKGDARYASQQSSASIKHKADPSISNNVVKTTEKGDTRYGSQQNSASVKHKADPSISNNVVKTSEKGDTRYGSQQNSASVKHKADPSISNNVVKTPASNSNDKSGDSGNLDELEKLANLRDKGIITDDEFQAKKKQILGL